MVEAARKVTRFAHQKTAPPIFLSLSYICFELRCHTVVSDNLSPQWDIRPPAKVCPPLVLQSSKVHVHAMHIDTENWDENPSLSYTPKHINLNQIKTLRVWIKRAFILPSSPPVSLFSPQRKSFSLRNIKYKEPNCLLNSEKVRAELVLPTCFCFLLLPLPPTLLLLLLAYFDHLIIFRNGCCATEKRPVESNSIEAYCTFVFASFAASDKLPTIMLRLFTSSFPPHTHLTHTCLLDALHPYLNAHSILAPTYNLIEIIHTHTYTLKINQLRHIGKGSTKKLVEIVPGKTRAKKYEQSALVKFEL